MGGPVEASVAAIQRIRDEIIGLHFEADRANEHTLSNLLADALVYIDRALDETRRREDTP
jgi:hypothetical protein